VLTLESFASTSLGLAVGSFAPSTDAALAIGPGIMVLFIVVRCPGQRGRVVRATTESTLASRWQGCSLKAPPLSLPRRDCSPLQTTQVSAL